MARNIEIKAHIPNVAEVALRAAELADKAPVEIWQNDTFFYCQAGRLKLRFFADGEGELIFYRRADESGPKELSYIRVPTSNPEMLREALSLAYGERGHVRKRRTLYLIGRTRIHLDQVERLGDFLELEVVLAEAEGADTGTLEAKRLMSQLGITEDQLIERAYIDLLESTAHSQEMK